MRLSEEDVTLFYKLYPALLVYINAEQGILSQISTTDELMSQPVEEKVRVRDQLYENIALIDSFANDNPFGFTSEELEIVRSWKHFIRDRFYLFRHLKKYSIFLSSGSPPKAYGVLSISDRLKDLFPYVPVLVETVLLPFKGQIVYDGYVGAFRISFGGGIRVLFPIEIKTKEMNGARIWTASIGPCPAHNAALHLTEKSWRGLTSSS